MTKLTVDVGARRQGRILSQDVGDIIVGAIGVLIGLAGIVVVLEWSARYDQRTARENTLMSTLYSQFRVLWGTAAMTTEPSGTSSEMEKLRNLGDIVTFPRMLTQQTGITCIH